MQYSRLGHHTSTTTVAAAVLLLDDGGSTFFDGRRANEAKGADGCLNGDPHITLQLCVYRRGECLVCRLHHHRRRSARNAKKGKASVARVLKKCRRSRRVAEKKTRNSRFTCHVGLRIFISDVRFLSAFSGTQGQTVQDAGGTRRHTSNVIPTSKTRATGGRSVVVVCPASIRIGVATGWCTQGGRLPFPPLRSVRKRVESGDGKQRKRGNKWGTAAGAMRS